MRRTWPTGGCYAKKEQHVDDDEDGAMVEWYWQGQTEVLGPNPASVPLCPPKITHALMEREPFED